MDLAYSFYCSRCRFDHAGECTGTISAAAAVRSPLVNGVPTVGSRWRTENHMRDGSWLVRHSQVYVVTKVEGGKAWIQEEGNGYETFYDFSAWSETGLGVAGWRFARA